MNVTDLIGTTYKDLVVVHVKENDGSIYDREAFPYFVADGTGKFVVVAAEDLK